MSRATKMSWLDGVMTVEFVNDREETERLVSGGFPHEDLTSLLDSLSGVFCTAMDIPKKMQERVRAYGIEEKNTKDSYGFVILARITSTAFGPMKVRTPFIEAYYLDQDDRLACENLLDEALLYAEKDKRGRSGDLFEDAGETEA